MSDHSLFPVPEEVAKNAFIDNDKYLEMYQRSVDDPEGGFYLFPDFEPLAESLDRRQIGSSAELTRRCLEEAGVAFLPGSCFGRSPEERTARIAYVNFDGTRALAEASERGDEHAGDLANLPACEGTRDAVRRLTDWLRA